MTANWAEKRALGRTGLMVTGICVGTSPIASIPRIYGYEVGEDRGVATVEAVLNSRFNFMDTSNSYGAGAGEQRIGKAIGNVGGLPRDFVLATKVDADKTTRDFSGARVRRSIEESLERLGLDHVPLLHVHDPEYYFPSAAEAMKKGGPVEELIRIREEGLADHIGMAAGPIPMLLDFVRTGVFEAVLSHNRYTLLDRSALPLMKECQARGIAYLNAAPYGGGMLIKGPDATGLYAYRPAKEEVTAAARAMQRACAARGVPLAAAALQFSLRSPLVASTVIGFSSPERIAETIALAEHPIPADLWDELEALAVPEEVWLN